jgi:hypothetical protein
MLGSARGRWCNSTGLLTRGNRAAAQVNFGAVSPKSPKALSVRLDLGVLTRQIETCLKLKAIQFPEHPELRKASN